MIYPQSYFNFFEKNFKTITFIDIETTGLDPMRNEIITLSCGVVDFHTMDLIDEIELNFKPEYEQYWGVEAEAVHKISLETAKGFSDRVESVDKLIKFLDFYKVGTPQIFCCHALNFKGQGFFDWNFLLHEFLKYKKQYELYKNFHAIQSTLNYVVSAKLGLVNNKLDTIAKHYAIELNHHDAKSDRNACHQIYKKLKEY